jgi:hypothetical protein
LLAFCCEWSRKQILFKKLPQRLDRWLVNG